MHVQGYVTTTPGSRLYSHPVEKETPERVVNLPTPTSTVAKLGRLLRLV